MTIDIDLTLWLRRFHTQAMRYARFLLIAAAALVDAQDYDLSALKWRNIGPNRGGRSQAIAGSAQRPLEYYFGATGGGLWKTTNGGVTWFPVTDGQIRSSSVGAVAESNPDIVYLGMGETELRGNIMQGDGVYKSADAGKTWKHAGLADTQSISRNSHRSVESGYRVCRGVGASVRTQYGARYFPIERRRRDMETRSVSQRSCGCNRFIDGSEKFACAVRFDLGCVSNSVDAIEWRTIKRFVQVE